MAKHVICSVIARFRCHNTLPQFLKMSCAASPLTLKRDAAEIDTDDKEDNSKKPKIENENQVRIKYKKMAMMLSYSGKGYMGMQKNPGVTTIESELFSALLRANLIKQEHCDDPHLLGFQRAARTDKGVSAVRQIVSIRLPVNEDLKEAVRTINSTLPPEIRVMGIKRTTKSFNSKINCDARTYSYMLPTFAFAPLETLVTEEYRITDSVLEQVNSFLSKYLGTYSYYNFTSGRDAVDPSCRRYIINCECGKPFIRDGLEFAVITVKGQSFMLHQIRKMVGLAIAVLRGLADEETLYKARKLVRLDLPIAPGLGLMLEAVHYELYNKRYGGDGVHEALTWEEDQDTVQKFKEEYIYPTIIQTEKNEKSMLEWMGKLAYHSYDIRDKNLRSEEESLTNNSKLFGAGIKVEILEKARKSEVEESGNCSD